MQKKQLGSSNIYVSELTLGCMSLGQDKQTAKRIIETALDAGINHLDTADLYDFGLNEELLGEIIKDYRQDLILTTKVGNHFNKEEKNWFWDPSRKYIMNAVKMSLQRLQTDYIDLYMLHGGTIDDPIDETIAAFEELKKEGLIRTYGISSIRPNVIREYVTKSKIDAVMLQYSLFDRRPEETILGLLQENQISALSRGPLAKGMLSNIGKKQIEKKAKDGYLEYTQEELLQSFERMINLTDGSLTMNELALKYVLKHPAVTSAVFGASSVEQVKENAQLSNSMQLPNNIYEQLQKITKNNHYTSHR